MIKIANAQLWVHDQDEALAFYTEKVGMEVRARCLAARDGQLPLAGGGPAGQPDIVDRPDGDPRAADDGRGDAEQVEPGGQGVRRDRVPDDR